MGGMGLFGMSACMLYHWVGISLSGKMNFFCLLMIAFFYGYIHFGAKLRFFVQLCKKFLQNLNKNRVKELIFIQTDRMGERISTSRFYFLTLHDARL
jgi:hypothetical protein